MKQIWLLISALTVFSGCVSFSRHANILANTESPMITGVCDSRKFQNSIEVKASGLQIWAKTFTESAGFGLVVPFMFEKSDAVIFQFDNFISIKDPESYLSKIRLHLRNTEASPSTIEVAFGGYQVKFAVGTLKDVQGLELLLPQWNSFPETRITFSKDNEWYFIPILIPHSAKCVTRAKI